MKQPKLKLITSATPKPQIKVNVTSKKTWLLILDVANSLLKHNEYCTFSEIVTIMRHAGVRVRYDLIPCSFISKPYWIDCQTRRIYKWEK